MRSIFENSESRAIRGSFAWLLGSAALLALPAQAYAQATPEQTPDATPASMPVAQGGLGDIVVTARKTAENLQDVPVAVTAFSGEDLVQQGVADVSDLGRVTPGFQTREGNGNASSLALTVRGQVQTDTIITLDPSVGIYVDDYYVARATGVNGDLVDIQSVQVLKGPQGTLFGRNTTGGAVLITTANPDLNSFNGLAGASYGRFDDYSLTGVINMPIVTDKIALRLAAKYRARDGYLTDDGYANNVGGLRGQRYNDRDTLTGRAKLLLQPTDNFSLLFSAEYYRAKGNYSANHTQYVVPGGTLAGVLGSQQAIDDYLAYSRNPDNISHNYLPSIDTETQTYVGTASLDTFFGQVKFIGGYRTVSSDNSMDLDGSPYPVHGTTNAVKADQYSGELQITGQTVDGKLDFAAGMTYFHESGYDRNFSAGDEAAAFASILSGEVDNDSMGAYTQLTYHFTDRLRATGGLRYSVDDKGILINNGFGSMADLNTPNRRGCLYPTISPNPAAAPAPCYASRHDSFGGWSYTAGLDYDLADDILVYVKTSKGFRSGGQNLRAIRGVGAPDPFIPFRPEIAYSHELGLKSQFWNRRARLNVAAYYTLVKDLQKSVILPSNSIPPATSTAVQNAGEARVYGVEAELLVEPVDGVTLGATGTLTRPKYLEYVDPAGNDLSDTRFENVARHTFTLSAAYAGTFGANGYNLRADYAWQDTTPLQPQNDAATVAYATNPASGVLNARAGVTLMNDALDLSVYGKNILDNRDPVSALRVDNYGYITARYREPATYGVEATFRFGD